MKNRVRTSGVRRVAGLLLGAWLLSTPASAQVFSPTSGAANPFDGVDVGFYSMPSLGDVDGDGDVDAVVGEFDGKLRYFKNTGTATAPVYAQQTGSANPFNSVDVGSYSSPSLGDVDGDGDLDALVGDQVGTLWYYKNTGTTTAPVYAQQTGAANPFNGVDVGLSSFPSLGDVDGDGDVDAVVGESTGTLRYFKNTGTTTAPVYVQQTGAANPFNGVDLTVVGSTYSTPSLGDVDGDGDLDAIVGQQGGKLRYFKNTGTATAPVYAEQTGTANPFNGVDVGLESAPSLGDVDGDGDLDALVGESTGTLRYFNYALVPPQVQTPTPASQTVCVGSSASSTVAASGIGTLTYAWYRNQADTDEPVSGQTSATLSLSNVQLANAGSYFVRVTGAGGSTWSTAFVLTVNPPATAGTPTLGSSAICQGGSVSVSASFGGGATGGSFSDGGACGTFSTPTTNGSTVSATYTPDPNFTGQVTITFSTNDPDGPCPAATSTGSLTVNPLPVVSLSALAATYCQNAPASTPGTPAGGSYAIDNGNPVATFNPATLSVGPHTVVYTYTNPAGCSASATQSVTIIAPTFTQQPNLPQNLTVCANGSVSFAFDVNCPANATFTAQLSDAGGSFANPLSLGTVTPGSNTVQIPADTPGGEGYRLRVVGSNPTLTSDRTRAFTITALSVALYPATPGRICQRTDALPVTFSTVGNCPFPQGNTFTVQLSNATGSFANPLVLGVAQPGTTTFPASLLNGLPAGTGYRVRIVTSNPATTSFGSAPFRLEGPSLNLTPGVAGAPVCRGGQVTVSFTLAGCPFFEGNAFTAQLSSASGSFASPVSLGAVQAGVANAVTIPANVAAGTGYRIRLVSSSPALTSLNSAPFRVNATGCTNRLSAGEAELVVVPNPVVGRDIRVRVSGLDNPEFSLSTTTGRSVGLWVKTDGSGEFVLMPKQALPVGVYVLGASEGTTRLTSRVLVSE